MKRSLLVFLLLLGACGGSTATSASDPSGPRPVRVDSTEPTTGEAAHPVRVAPTIPGEAAETDDLADPPPVEAPTSR
jgi:hypothetical protein